MSSILDQFLTEDDINIEEDLDNRDDQYRDIYTQLDKYTNGFTREAGEFPLETKSEIENAETILKDHYKNVEKAGLDYDLSSVDGTMYKIKYSEPISNTNEDLEEDELKFEPAIAFNSVSESLLKEEKLPSYNDLDMARIKKLETTKDDFQENEVLDEFEEMFKLLTKTRYLQDKAKKGPIYALANELCYLLRYFHSDKTIKLEKDKDGNYIVNDRDLFLYMFMKDGTYKLIEIIGRQFKSPKESKVYKDYKAFCKNQVQIDYDHIYKESLNEKKDEYGLPGYNDLYDAAKKRNELKKPEFFDLLTLKSKERWEKDKAKYGEIYANAAQVAEFYGFWFDLDAKVESDENADGETFYKFKINNGASNVDFIFKSDGSIEKINLVQDKLYSYKSYKEFINKEFAGSNSYIKALTKATLNESQLNEKDEFGLPTFDELFQAAVVKTGGIGKAMSNKEYLEMFGLRAKEHWNKVFNRSGKQKADADLWCEFCKFYYTQNVTMSENSSNNNIVVTLNNKFSYAFNDKPGSENYIENYDEYVLTKKHKYFRSLRELFEFVNENASNCRYAKKMLKVLDESIEKHDELNSDLWDNNELKPEVKDKLLEIVQKFDDNLKQDGIELDVKDVRIIGSNASYNYTKDSDIDLHIYADLSRFEDHEDLALKLYQAYKNLWNNKYDPTIYGHEVELYVEEASDENKQN